MRTEQPVSPAALEQRMKTVWGERAERLSRRADLLDARKNFLPVMVLGIGRERYGINLPDVAEVLPSVRPTPVPGTASLFAGVINVHGEIRPVIDLRRWLGVETAPDGELSRVILLRKEGREMGLQIDSVEQILWLGPEDLESAANRLPGLSPHLKGSTKDLLMLLSTEALFRELQTGATT